MTPYNTQYHKDYRGENAHTEVHEDFYKLVKKIDNLGIPLRRPKTGPVFESHGGNSTAESVVLLSYEMPLAEVYLRGIKWGDKCDVEKASLSISIRNFKGPDPSFPKLEEIAKQFNLIPRRTHKAHGC